MSISYEDALAALESMFGATWSREMLDVVLRHEKGHMENTVDLILRHGDKDPQILVDQIDAGIDPSSASVSADAQLAQQLSSSAGLRRIVTPPSPSVSVSSTRTSSSSSSGGRMARGQPVTLPDDFLRIPGYTAPSYDMSQDEALARMLQDELFSQELARNPDFAHLARGGGPRTSNTMATNRGVGGGPQSTSGGGPPLADNIMKNLSDLGENAKRRLQLLAAQFNRTVRTNMANINNNNNDSSSRASLVGGAAMAGSASDSDAVAERRGLLDDNDNMELAARKDL